MIDHKIAKFNRIDPRGSRLENKTIDAVDPGLAGIRNLGNYDFQQIVSLDDGSGNHRAARAGIECEAHGNLKATANQKRSRNLRIVAHFKRGGKYRAVSGIPVFLGIVERQVSAVVVKFHHEVLQDAVAKSAINAPPRERPDPGKGRKVERHARRETLSQTDLHAAMVGRV